MNPYYFLLKKVKISIFGFVKWKIETFSGYMKARGDCFCERCWQSVS